MNVVFIGGPIDGQRRVLLDGQTRYECVEYDKMMVKNPELHHLSHQVHGYNLFHLHPVTRACLFAHESMTPTQIMERLLEFYNISDDKHMRMIQEEAWATIANDGGVNWSMVNFAKSIYRRTIKAIGPHKNDTRAQAGQAE